jgi:DNA-binding NarL/FixJ family response regulator
MGSTLGRLTLEAASGVQVEVGRGFHDSGDETQKELARPVIASSGLVIASSSLSVAASRKYPMLSPRERAVLVAAALGAEDKEIAANLGCSISTIRTLWQRTYRKMREPSRRRLVALIWEEAYRLASVSIIR